MVVVCLIHSDAIYVHEYLLEVVLILVVLIGAVDTGAVDWCC